MKIKLKLLLLLLSVSTAAYSQTPTDTVKKPLFPEIFNKIKFSGYIQAQWQHADTAGAKNFSGGNFLPNSDNRFMVRRGRFKVTYENKLAQYVFQIDAIQSGVSVKDAYIKLTEPWKKTISLTAGIFDRPFGYEISYSSSNRESPERSRIFQTLFPGERDLGAKITIGSKEFLKGAVKLDAGLFNGTGPAAVDYDSKKDFISHLTLKAPLKNENLTLSGGLSYYHGYLLMDSIIFEDIEMLSDGIKRFIADTVGTNFYGKRRYAGADLQIGVKYPLGILTIKGEYITGKQPGAAKSNIIPSALQAPPVFNNYLRTFQGGYVILTQNIKKKNAVVVKYDWFDPNKEVEGNEIGAAGSNLKEGDIQYATLGFGWIFNATSNVRLTTYYEAVNNEKTELTDFTRDLKDDIFTFRIQYKF